MEPIRVLRAWGKKDAEDFHKSKVRPLIRVVDRINGYFNDSDLFRQVDEARAAPAGGAWVKHLDLSEFRGNFISTSDVNTLKAFDKLNDRAKRAGFAFSANVSTLRVRPENDPEGKGGYSCDNVTFVMYRK